MSSFYLGIGSNQGDRLNNIKSALTALADCGDITAISSVYETEPKYEVKQPKFLNLVCLIDSELAAIELFEAVKMIEQQIGRLETYKNGPRIIDIDLLYSPEETYSDEILKIPHAKLAERAFVLVPFAEIAPSLNLSNLGCTVAKALSALDKKLLDEVSLYSKEALM